MIPVNGAPGIHAESLWVGAVGADTNLLRGGSPPRWVLAGTGGVLNATDPTGAAVALQLQAGVSVPISLASLVAAGSTAHTLTLVW